MTEDPANNKTVLFGGKKITFSLAAFAAIKQNQTKKNTNKHTSAQQDLGLSLSVVILFAL